MQTAYLPDRYHFVRSDSYPETTLALAAGKSNRRSEIAVVIFHQVSKNWGCVIFQPGYLFKLCLLQNWPADERLQHPVLTISNRVFFAVWRAIDFPIQIRDRRIPPRSQVTLDTSQRPEVLCGDLVSHIIQPGKPQPAYRQPHVVVIELRN